MKQLADDLIHFVILAVAVWSLGSMTYRELVKKPLSPAAWGQTENSSRVRSG